MGRAPVVFISSTIDDLKPYRDAAKEAAIGAGFLPVLSQYFPASQHQNPLDLCRERVKEVDVLLVIVGHRYGWTPDGPENADQKSITWFECEAAADAGQEVLAFLVDSEFRGLDEWKERNRLLQAQDIVATAAEVQRNERKLDEFRSWLGDARRKFHRKTFQEPKDLQYEVRIALDDWRKRHREFAWQPAPEPRREADPTRYLELLRDASGYIEVRGLKVGSGTANRYPIEDLYIPLTTLPPAEPRLEERDRKPIDLHAALRSPKLVIVGDPGAGKTTFLRRVAFALSQTLLGEDPSAAEQRLGLKQRQLPILIRIGDLAEYISKRRKQPECTTTDESPDWLLHFLASKSEEFDWGLERMFFRQLTG